MQAEPFFALDRFFLVPADGENQEEERDREDVAVMKNVWKKVLKLIACVELAAYVNEAIFSNVEQNVQEFKNCERGYWDCGYNALYIHVIE